MINAAKLAESLILADKLQVKHIPARSLVCINDAEGRMMGMAFPIKGEDGVLSGYQTEAYPLVGDVGVLDWDNLVLVKVYVAAKMLGHWEDISELHPSNR